MLTNKFKATVATGIVVVLGGGLVANQVVQQKQLRLLQEEVNTKPKVIMVRVSPTPTASPTATMKFVPIKVVVPTK